MMLLKAHSSEKGKGKFSFLHGPLELKAALEMYAQDEKQVRMTPFTANIDLSMLQLAATLYP